MRTFRLTKRKHAATAFDGEGARINGARWNSVGTPMVYTAQSLALATCEWRVHLDGWPAPPMVAIPVDFEERLVWAPDKFPNGWDALPAPRVAAEFGDAWIRSGRSAALRVPSVVVPGESNYLLNPKHPDFAKMRIGSPFDYLPDARFAPSENL